MRLRAQLSGQGQVGPLFRRCFQRAQEEYPPFVYRATFRLFPYCLDILAISAIHRQRLARRPLLRNSLWRRDLWGALMNERITSDVKDALERFHREQEASVMWRTALSMLALVVLGVVGWFFLSGSFGSYHTIYDCSGKLQSTAGNSAAASAFVDLEQFHWFKMKVGDIAGIAEVEMVDPPLFDILYVFKQSDNHLNLHQIPRANEDRGEYAGGFSSLSRSLVVELADGLVFDGLCSVRDDGR